MTYQRFSITELSVRRVFAAITRRIHDVPDAVAWNMEKRRNRINVGKLEAFADRHRNERCFIIGNGPSLKRMELSPLKNEYTFGLNRIYLLFNELSFVSTYYVCMNELVLEQFASDIRELTMPKFLNWNRRSHFDQMDSSTLFVRLGYSLNDFFGTDLKKALSGGGTVTYVALQIAYYMGFKEVILIGVDHNFADKGTPNTTEVRKSEIDPNHFHPNYFPKGVKWQLPDLRHSEAAYALARNAYEKAGRNVVDATVDGKCPIFQKVSFSTLF